MLLMTFYHSCRQVNFIQVSLFNSPPSPHAGHTGLHSTCRYFVPTFPVCGANFAVRETAALHRLPELGTRFIINTEPLATGFRKSHYLLVCASRGAHKQSPVASFFLFSFTLADICHEAGKPVSWSDTCYSQAEMLSNKLPLPATGEPSNRSSRLRANELARQVKGSFTSSIFKLRCRSAQLALYLALPVNGSASVACPPVAARPFIQVIRIG